MSVLSSTFLDYFINGALILLRVNTFLPLNSQFQLIPVLSLLSETLRIWGTRKRSNNNIVLL